MTDDARRYRIRESLVDRALELIAARGWSGCDTAAVIAAAGVTEEEFHREFGSMLSLVIAASRRVTAAMHAARAQFEPEDSVRDRLFALVMARVDAARAFKPAIAELARAAPRDPLLAATGARVLGQAARTTLAGAGIATQGPSGFARVSGFTAGVILPVVRAWLDDDSEDDAKTMATLDRCLERAERFASAADPCAEAR